MDIDQIVRSIFYIFVLLLIIAVLTGLLYDFDSCKDKIKINIEEGLTIEYPQREYSSECLGLISDKKMR
jgi:hypothetical protein